MRSSTLCLAGRKICRALSAMIVPASMTLPPCTTWAQSPVATASAAIRDVPTYLNGNGIAVASRSTVVRSGIEGELTEIDFTGHQRVQVGDLLARVEPPGRPAQPDTAHDDLTELRSPVSGTAGQPLHQVGDVVGPADKAGVVAISRVEPIFVEFTLPARLPPVVQPRRTGGRVRAWAYGEDPLHPLAVGHVVLAEGGRPRETDRGKLEATFPNGDLALSPGMGVEIRVRAQIDRTPLTIPLSAVQRSATGYFVYLVTEGRTAHVRPIALGSVSDDVVVVRDGLQAGDVVVVDGQDQLAEGRPVAIVEGPSPRPGPD